MSVAALSGIGSVAVLGAIFGISAFGIAMDNRHTINNMQIQLTDLDARTPILVNDGSLVSGNVSLFGNPQVTDSTSVAPQLHFKSVVAGDNISVTDNATYILITNTLNIVLAPASSSNVGVVSLVASTSLTNIPIVRNLIGGTGITLSLDGDDIIIST